MTKGRTNPVFWELGYYTICRLYKYKKPLYISLDQGVRWNPMVAWGPMGGLTGTCVPLTRLDIPSCWSFIVPPSPRHCVALNSCRNYAALELSKAPQCVAIQISMVFPWSLSVGSKHQKLTSDWHSDCCRILKIRIQYQTKTSYLAQKRFDKIVSSYLINTLSHH